MLSDYGGLCVFLSEKSGLRVLQTQLLSQVLQPGIHLSVVASDACVEDIHDTSTADPVLPEPATVEQRLGSGL